MSSPNDAARLREIQRLLERIQQLPNVAGIPGNGLPNGFHDLPRAETRAPHDSRRIQHLRHVVGMPGNGLPNGFHALPLGPTPDPAPPHDPIVPSLDAVASPLFDASDREYAPPDLPRALVPVPQPPVSVGIAPWVFVVATAVNTVIAAVLAVVITLGMARREQPPAGADKAAAAPVAVAPFRPAGEPRSEPLPPRPVELLPVGSPAEPLRLEALKPARLPLQVRPLEAIHESYILILSGLPANAALSGASRMGADSWLLSPGGLQQIEIVVPEWSASTIEARAELRRTNGAVVAQSKVWLAVPPPPAPQGNALSESAIKEMVKNGDRLLSRGDVAAARALYEKAAAMGNAQAALALGSTYDPRRLWSLGVFGMVGNKERAQQWYRRAAELGHPEAKARISALQDR
jgi:Sel1 repeat